MKNLTVETILKGYYLQNETKYSISIVRQNWDFFFEEKYDDLGSPDLNSNGYAFYVLYGDYEKFLNANRSRSCLSKGEAIRLAEEVVVGELHWLKD